MNIETETETDNETRQYCVTVKVWVWAFDTQHAEDLVADEMKFLVGVDNPLAGFDVVTAEEDKEI